MSTLATLFNTLRQNLAPELHVHLDIIQQALENDGKPLKDKQQKPTNTKSEFEQLTDLLKSEEWPQAVHPSQICNNDNEQAKQDRANAIVDLVIAESFKGKRFLDFGTGQGHVTHAAANQDCKVSVGYDIHRPEESKFEWEKNEEKMLLTTQFKEVKAHAPYDIVLMYDVLDHIRDKQEINVLKQVKSILSPKGVVYLRCHPWCGRHGGHYYQQINKAFVNVVFDKKELTKLEYSADEYVTEIKYPQYHYTHWITKSGFRPDKPIILPSTIERFFEKTPQIRKRVMALYADPMKKSRWPNFQLSQAFLDYVLR